MSVKSILLVGLAIVVVGIATYEITNTKKASANIASIEISKPYVYVYGTNLQKVELWGIPTGTNITEKDYQLLGLGVLHSASSGAQTWAIPIPSQPLLLTNVFAKGYDSSGSLVGQVSLPQTGATDLTASLWSAPVATSTAPQPDGDLVLGVGQSGDSKGLAITFNSVVQDNRCPVGVTCIAAGAVIAHITLAVGSSTQEYNLSSGGVPYQFSGYSISITQTSPARENKKDISANAYQITFHVDKTTSSIACTADAKACPDGSYVGRVGLSCNFAQCPNATSTGIKGNVLLGPTCPVMRNPPDPACADKPYATQLLITLTTNPQVIKRITSDAQGNFSIALPSGQYDISNTSTLPRCSASVTVPSATYAHVVVYCDTGIR